MKTIHRNDSRYKPKFNFINNTVNFVADPNLTNLIKRTDEICEKYGFEYDEPIYKVIETGLTGTMENTGVRLKSGKTRYSGQENIEKVFYEAKIRKVVAS